MKKQTLKQFIFSEMEKKNFVLDQEVYNFIGDEEFSYNTVEQYKREYQRFEWAKEYFKDIKNPILQKCNRKYLIRDNSWEESLYNVIPKIYYEYLCKLNKK